METKGNHPEPLLSFFSELNPTNPIATPFPASHLPLVYYGRTGVIVQFRNEEEEKVEEKKGGDESLGSEPVEDFTSRHQDFKRRTSTLLYIVHQIFSPFHYPIHSPLPKLQFVPFICLTTHYILLAQ